MHAVTTQADKVTLSSLQLKVEDHTSVLVSMSILFYGLQVDEIPK